MDYEKLHKDTIQGLQELVAEGRITEEIAKRICADFVAENEDERIRKEMIHFLKSEKAFQTIALPVSERWIAYLEKQKEQMGKQAREKSEIPINQKDLEKEIDKRYLQSRIIGYVDGVGEIILDREAFGRIARHFAGWQKEQMMKILNKYQEKGARCVQQSIDADEQGEATYWDGFYDACLAIEREIQEDKK